MAEGVRGDFKALDALALKIRQIGSNQFKAEMGKVLGATALKQLSDGFRQSTNPYGGKWKSLVLRSGKPLQDTGRLLNSFTAKPTANGFAVETNVYYARTHQLGAGMDGSPIPTIVPVRAKQLAWQGRDRKWHRRDAVNIPRRQMVPQPDTGGMGSKWGDALNKEADDLLHDQLDLPK